MKDYLKFLKRLPKKHRLQLIKTVEAIAAGELSNLDIKQLDKDHKVHRCRVGKIRILFQKRGEKNFILDIGFRGDIYKNL